MLSWRIALNLEPLEEALEGARPGDAAVRKKIKEAAMVKGIQSGNQAKKRKLWVVEDDDVNKLADMASGEQISMDDKGNNDYTTFCKIRDNSERAFYKELVKVIDAFYVILEVLDARDPLGTCCLDMEKMVMRSGPEKHLMLLLNEIDLVPREAAEKWLKYLREELPAVAFMCSTQEQKSNLGRKSSSKAGKTTNLLQTSDCLGTENLIKLLKNYS